VYGSRKTLKAARRAGLDVGRDRVARLMRSEGLVGAVAARSRSRPARTAKRPGPPTSSTASSAWSPRTGYG
jgi:putative transposase